MKSLIIISALFISSNLAFAEESNKLEDVFQFLKNNIVKKTLVTATSGTFDDDTVSYDFERNLIFSNLSRGETSISFAYSWVINQKLFPLRNGERALDEVTIKNRVGTTTCALAQRKTTLKVTGICSNSFNSMTDSNGSGDETTLEIVGDTLVFTRTTIGHGDFFADDGYKPGSSRYVEVYSCDKNEKLQVLSSGTSYYLDPQTLQRIESSKKEDSFESHER